MIFDHEQLFEQSGLHHGTGAICCGCPDCHCLNCYLKKYHKRKYKKKELKSLYCRKKGSLVFSRLVREEKRIETEKNFPTARFP